MRCYLWFAEYRRTRCLIQQQAENPLGHWYAKDPNSLNWRRWGKVLYVPNDAVETPCELTLSEANNFLRQAGVIL